MITPHPFDKLRTGFNPPPSRGRKVFRELDAPQLCCGILHLITQIF